MLLLTGMYKGLSDPNNRNFLGRYPYFLLCLCNVQKARLGSVRLTSSAWQGYLSFVRILFRAQVALNQWKNSLTVLLH